MNHASSPLTTAATQHGKRWWTHADLALTRLELGLSESQRQWVITAYALAFGAFLLIGGRISDH